jgi:hypothetical protein
MVRLKMLRHETYAHERLFDHTDSAASNKVSASLRNGKVHPLMVRYSWSQDHHDDSFLIVSAVLSTEARGCTVIIP